MACVTSFNLYDFKTLCEDIYKKYNNSIEYIWIDTICINQKNYEKRKETIYRMSDIYKYSSNIICVPDLHIGYLKKNPSNTYIIDKIKKYRKEIIYIINSGLYTKVYSYYSNYEHVKSLIDESKTLNIKEIKKIVKCINWICYIIEYWINRTWVISEFLIGQSGNMCLYLMSINHFADYNYFDLNINTSYIMNHIINSKTLKHEDRFYAILPHTKYKDYIKDIQHWKLNTIIDVKLKLLEIIDVKEKIGLLYEIVFLLTEGYNSLEDAVYKILHRSITLDSKNIENKVVFINDIVLNIENRTNIFISAKYYKIINEKYIQTDEDCDKLGLLYFYDLVEVVIYLSYLKHFTEYTISYITVIGNKDKNGWIIKSRHEKIITANDFSKIIKDEKNDLKFIIFN